MFIYLHPEDRKWKMKKRGLSRKMLIAHSIRRHTIEGTFYLTGDCVLRSEELEGCCIVCFNRLSYNEEYDAQFCLTCDEWREEPCEDATCSYCSVRPKKPTGEA